MGGDTGKGNRPNQIIWVGLRVIVVVGILLGIATLPAVVLVTTDREGASAAANLMGVGFLIVLPFCIGAILSLILDLRGRHSMGFHALVNVVLIASTIAVGGVILREGIICIALLFPLWGAISFAGSMVVYHLHSIFAQRFTLNCSLLLAVPFLAMMTESEIHRADQFVVTRFIQIEASPEEIWPMLIALDSISESEGNWNITQNLLGVPKPRAARVVGDGVGARRFAEWSSDISFEEHIVSMEPGRELAWRFVFPNDSIQHRVDRHIEPDGRYLTIETGAYELANIGEGRSELRLRTAYAVRTPVNHYAAFWGELMLGDIQSNILSVIKQRAEQSRQKIAAG